jgi:hypothetical protein
MKYLLLDVLGFLYVFYSTTKHMGNSLSRQTTLIMLGFLVVTATASFSLLTLQQVNAQTNTTSSSSAAAALYQS